MNEDAQRLGRLGGLARNRWTPEQRSEAARRAVIARWARRDTLDELKSDGDKTDTK